MSNMSELSDEAFYLSQDLEINIRGRYLRFSASVEGLMTKCIVYLNEVNTLSNGKEETIDFKNFTFFKKVEKFKKLLELVYKDLYLENLQLFENLLKFGEMRNKMAHCYFSWDEFDLSSVIIWDIEDKITKSYKVIPTKHKVNEIKISLAESMKEIIDSMNILASEIIKRVTPLIPNMFN